MLAFMPACNAKVDRTALEKGVPIVE